MPGSECYRTFVSRIRTETSVSNRDYRSAEAVACWDNVFSSVQWGYWEGSMWRGDWLCRDWLLQWEIASILSIHLMRGCTDLAMSEQLAATPGTRAKLARKTLMGDESPLARQPD